MDELELLKKDWQKKEAHLPKLTYNEIYNMIWKKSSSIVKWIFYISIIELVFWIILNLAPFFMDNYTEKANELDIYYSPMFIVITSIIAFGVIFVFIYYLYKTYRAISAADSIKTLMESILKTRQIVKYYVIYNVAVMVIITIYTIFNAFTNNERVIKLLETIEQDGSQLKVWLFMALITFAGLIVTVGFLWLFYQLIYGFLLKKLKRNYSELKRLEV